MPKIDYNPHKTKLKLSDLIRIILTHVFQRRQNVKTPNIIRVTEIHKHMYISFLRKLPQDKRNSGDEQRQRLTQGKPRGNK